jgi:hypothetical protein
MAFSSGYALENNYTHPQHSQVETTTQKPKPWKFSRKLQKGTQEQTHNKNPLTQLQEQQYEMKKT